MLGKKYSRVDIFYPLWLPFMMQWLQCRATFCPGIFGMNFLSPGCRDLSPDRLIILYHYQSIPVHNNNRPVVRFIWLDLISERDCSCDGKAISRLKDSDVKLLTRPGVTRPRPQTSRPRPSSTFNGLRAQAKANLLLKDGLYWWLNIPINIMSKNVQ